MVIPSPLYSLESWIVYACHVRQLNSFHMRCISKLLRVQSFNHILDTEILERASTVSIFALISRNQLRWSGHVASMLDNRLPKQIFYGELCLGRCTQGRPRKRYKDMLGDTLDNCGIPRKSWNSLAQDRSSWRRQVRTGVATY